MHFCEQHSIGSNLISPFLLIIGICSILVVTIAQLRRPSDTTENGESVYLSRNNFCIECTLTLDAREPPSFGDHSFSDCLYDFIRRVSRIMEMAVIPYTKGLACCT